MHASECGAACLGSVLGFFGRHVSLTELREKCEVSRDGSSAASIVRAAKHYKLDAKGLSVKGYLLKSLSLPLILFWQYSHFVVLEGYRDDRYYLNDPSSGRRTVSAEEFEKSYSGVALQFSPTEQFLSGGALPSLGTRLLNLFADHWKVLVTVCFLSLLLALFSLTIPLTLTYFVDGVLLGNRSWPALVFLLLGAGVIAYLSSLFKFRMLERLALRFSVKRYDQTMSKLLRLPIDFFDHRLVGDVTDRVASIDRIARNMSSRFLVTGLEVLLSVVFLIALFFYDVRLTFVVLAIGAVHLVIAFLLNRPRHIRSQAMRREQGLLLGLGMQMLRHADNLRMTGMDDRFFSRWAGQQAKELTARQHYEELNLLNSALPAVAATIRTATVLALGGYFVIVGEMTIGMLAGFYVLAELFLNPIGRILEFENQRQDLETELQRINDVTLTKVDPIYTRIDEKATSIRTFKQRLHLTGRVELRNVTFGYNKSRPPLIKDFNLTIKPGQRVAIVGASGSGKSTLAYLVSGLSQPWSGEILFDGYLRDRIPEEVLQRSISVVSQEAVLFAASVRDNITLWNSAIPNEAIVEAARDARIHSEILNRPSGYATVVEESGRNFSGGQRQRIEIARALVGNPTVLILDEATSALDAETEEFVDDALRRRGVTCLIIAHRLSTVRDCDEIVVLEQGEVIERGTHSSLISNEAGHYFNLLKST